MKTFKITLLFVLAITMATLFVSCDNNDDDNNPVAVNFNFEYVVDGQDFVVNDVYTINGTAISFELAQFYVSGINLIQEGGTAAPVDKYLLVTPSTPKQEIAELTPATYEGIRFDVGVQPADNDQSEEDFTSRSSDDPLSEQAISMHWNWAAGYKFIRLDGLVDTDGDNVPETAMSFHLGKDNFLTKLDLAGEITTQSGQQDITLVVDIAKMLEGIDLSTDYFTHTADNLPLAEAFFANLPDAFRIK